MKEHTAFKMRHLLTEVILGYVFWSLFQGLPAMIWFYPLNEMAVTGYEGLVAILLLPAIMGIPFIRNLVNNRKTLGVLRVVAVACLASFHAPTTLCRLIILTIGAGATFLVFAATLCSVDRTQRAVTIWGFLLSFITVLVSRIWYVSVYPTWSDNTSNIIIIIIGSIATLARIISGFDGLCSVKSFKPAHDNVTKTDWVHVALGFGSLLYLTNAVFGEVSVVSRWTVGTYPDPGPAPNPRGFDILGCLVIGLIAGDMRPEVATSFIFWLVGAASFLALYYLPTLMGFIGGAILAVYVMAIWPTMLELVTRCPIGRTFSLAVVTYIFQILYSVWTVAYNFVPGGVYTRETTGFLVIVVAILLGLGMVPEKSTFRSTLRTTFNPTFSRTVKAVLFLLMSLGLLGFANRWDSPIPKHLSKDSPKQFSALIWTMHFGYDNDAWPSLERGARLLENTSADVITLLETDASKPFMGNTDIAMWMSERLGMYVDFGPSTRDHTWGVLLLSKYPFVKSGHHLLPSPFGELAPAISATVNMSGSLVDFVVTHMGNDQDNLDRELQAAYLADLLDRSENPVVFLGYVTSLPGSRDYLQLTEKGRVNDIDSTDKKRWCEYIMYRGLARLGYARISHGGLTDTEVQMARFSIPKDPNNYADNKHIELDASKIDPAIRFSSKFGTFREGHNWERNHRFHMGTPKYFIP